MPYHTVWYVLAQGLRDGSELAAEAVRRAMKHRGLGALDETFFDLLPDDELGA